MSASVNIKERTGIYRTEEGRRAKYIAGSMTATEIGTGRVIPVELLTERIEPGEPVHLRYIDVTGEMAAQSLLLKEESQREIASHILDRLKIKRREGEAPYKTWLRAMCEENGFEFTMPVHPQISEAIRTDPSVTRFFFLMVTP